MLCLLPFHFGTWLETSLFLRNTGGLLLLSLWEVFSGLIPQLWRVIGFTALTLVLLVAIGMKADNPWRTTLMFCVVYFSSVMAMWHMGAFH